MILSDTTEKRKRRKTKILLSTMYKDTDRSVVVVDKQVFDKIHPKCGNFIEVMSKLVGVINNGI